MDLTSEQQEELDDLINNSNYTTKRPTVPDLEEILFTPIPVLDHGFIRVIDYMGDDSSIVQAARVSYGKGTKKVNEDAGLIKYLMRHAHSSPTEMCEIKLHIKLPIFIARQWVRHRTASLNEYSGRYSVMDKEFYIPSVENLAPQSTKNHQGRDEQNPLSMEESARVLQLLKDDATQCYDHYQEMLNLDDDGNILDDTKTGLARELARMNLNLNYYTQWYWKIDLHNLMHFLALRADAHAQYEIRAYADIMLDILKKWVPLTYAAFEDYKLNSSKLSGKGLNVVKELVKGNKVSFEESGMSKGEYKELMQLLDLE